MALRTTLSGGLPFREAPSVATRSSARTAASLSPDTPCTRYRAADIRGVWLPVMTVRGAAEAVAVRGRDRREVDILLTELMLPAMDAHAVLRAAAAIPGGRA